MATLAPEAEAPWPDNATPARPSPATVFPDTPVAARLPPPPRQPSPGPDDRPRASVLPPELQDATGQRVTVDIPDLTLPARDAATSRLQDRIAANQARSLHGQARILSVRIDRLERELTFLDQRIAAGQEPRTARAGPLLRLNRLRAERRSLLD